jgi:predicted hotdog family 3-hydroxylacyl-ACP dehydratase
VLLTRAWIEARIAHRGGMCLIDEVLDWDAQRIRCRSGTHRRADHPLRAHGRLGAACGIEYAAQAMAIHGALIAGPAAAASRTGYLASVRGVRLEVARLDDISGDLICEAARIAGGEDSVVYEFWVRAAPDPLEYLAHETGVADLLSGRATIAFLGTRSVNA